MTVASNVSDRTIEAFVSRMRGSLKLPRPAARVRAEFGARLWSRGLSVAVPAATPLILRLMIGRWPEEAEKIAFAKGVRSGEYGLPLLLRGAALVPAARPFLSRAAMLGRMDSEKTAPLSAGQMLGDPQRFWRGPKLRFLHLEKTAGSSLTTWLASHFHPSQIDADPLRGVPAHKRASHPTGATLVWGHYDLPTLRRSVQPGEKSFTFTLLRAPKARILSLYYYMRANTIDQAAEVCAARENGLAAFLADPTPKVRNMIDNLYVRRLTGHFATPGSDPLRENPKAVMAQAINAVDALDFVGFAEDLDAGLREISAMLGITPPKTAPRVNVLERVMRNPITPFRTVEYETITPEIDAQLEALTHMDRAIYAHCAERWGGAAL